MLGELLVELHAVRLKNQIATNGVVNAELALPVREIVSDMASISSLSLNRGGLRDWPLLALGEMPVSQEMASSPASIPSVQRTDDMAAWRLLTLA